MVLYRGEISYICLISFDFNLYYGKKQVKYFNNYPYEKIVSFFCDLDHSFMHAIGAGSTEQKIISGSCKAG